MGCVSNVVLGQARQSADKSVPGGGVPAARPAEYIPPLLPRVHSLWPYVTAALHSSHPPVIARALQ
eukprot:1440974-Pyramimonas_sp.AAC.1